MSTSDVRSIDSLIRLRHTLISVSGDWTNCLHQIKNSARRIEERFSVEIPAYWKHQTALAERSLAESLDNLSRLQSTSAGVSPGATEARMRVAKSRRRLAFCQEKEKRSRQLALTVEQACEELNGPIAEVAMHSEANLPAAAEELARMIDHLSRYAEIRPSTVDLPPSIDSIGELDTTSGETS
jgi:hypothetical protein